jgi:hypothetical protein
VIDAMPHAAEASPPSAFNWSSKLSVDNFLTGDKREDNKQNQLSRSQR